MAYDVADEIARLGLEAARISSRSGGGSVSTIAGRVSQARYGQGDRPQYDHTQLSAPDGGAASFTSSDIEEAVLELSERTGYAAEAIMTAVREMAPGRDAQESAVALAAAAQELLPLSYGEYGDDGLVGLAFSQDERDKYAKSGVAMPGGDFPIPDAKHLGIAKAYFHQGKLAGHSKAEVAAHINRRAKALGLPGLDDGDEDQDVAATAPAYRHRLVRSGNGYSTVSLSGSADYAPGYELPELDRAELDAAGWNVDEDQLTEALRGEIARMSYAEPGTLRHAGAEAETIRLSEAHPEFFGLAARRKGKTHLHTEPDAMDHAQPRDGGDVHSEVARYLRMAEHEFGGEAMHAGSHGSQSHAPKSRSQREREERRARRGPHGAHTNYGGWADRMP